MDTDDGSAYLRTHHNVMVYGDNGLKSDFGVLLCVVWWEWGR